MESFFNSLINIPSDFIIGNKFNFSTRMKNDV